MPWAKDDIKAAVENLKEANVLQWNPGQVFYIPTKPDFKPAWGEQATTALNKVIINQYADYYPPQEYYGKGFSEMLKEKTEAICPKCKESNFEPSDFPEKGTYYCMECCDWFGPKSPENSESISPENELPYKLTYSKCPVCYAPNTASTVIIEASGGGKSAYWPACKGAHAEEYLSYSTPLCTYKIVGSWPSASPEASKSDTPSVEVLKLMKGSKPEDWHRHINGGGWVYKTAKVSETAYVSSLSVVYKNAVVGDSAAIYSNVKVTGQIGEDSIVHLNTKIYGIVGKKCTIYNGVVIGKDYVVADYSIVKTTPVILRTQKARGVNVLSENSFDVPEHYFYKIEKLKTKKQLLKLQNSFVRPCPVSPRHGFVESRPVTTLAEVKQIVSETRAADPQAEIISMPFIQASHSGIWTEGQLSVGTNNDGATAGKDSVVIPVKGVPQPSGTVDWDSLKKAAGITDSPYLELLWTKHESTAEDVTYRTKYVQLRNGPKLPSTVDFIPAEMEVKHVVRASGELLKWETKVKEFEPGTVVYHPGGSLSSHYSVHCFVSNIPVLISREPKVGDVLKPNTETPEPDINKIRSGFILGCRTDLTHHQACYIMFAGCHSTVEWLGRQDLLIGMALGCAYRLLLTACLGEFRHEKPSPDHSSGHSREWVYMKYWDKSFPRGTRKIYQKCLDSFEKDSCWGGSYGGPKWFILGRWGEIIFNSLVDGDIKTAIEALNKGVNSVHNGGWTFNKFISQDQMTMTAKNPIYAVLKVAPVFYDILCGKKPRVKRFNRLLKFVVDMNLDAEKYLQEKSAPFAPSNKSIKSCCKSADCCGNPDCTECHEPKKAVSGTDFKLDFESCPCQAYPPHEGDQDTVLQNSVYTFVVCKKHLPLYTNVKVLKSCPESELATIKEGFITPEELEAAISEETEPDKPEKDNCGDPNCGIYGNEEGDYDSN